MVTLISSPGREPNPATHRLRDVLSAGPQGVALLRRLAEDLNRRQPQLAAAAWVCMFALVPVLLALAIDTRTVNGINVWIKPAKFLVSLAVYFATLAWVFGYATGRVQSMAAGRFVIAAALLAGLYEIVWLIAAAAYGVPSHFNYDGGVWSVAYQVAGLAAVLLVVPIFVQGWLVFRFTLPNVAPALRLAILLGGVIACFATLATASVLAAGTGHWVGGARTDVGGVPLVGWSRSGGDLRVAHFWALHAQQVLPLIGTALGALKVGRPRLAVVAAAAAYVALIVFTFGQALRGIPFIA